MGERDSRDSDNAGGGGGGEGDEVEVLSSFQPPSSSEYNTESLDRIQDDESVYHGASVFTPSTSSSKQKCFSGKLLFYLNNLIKSGSESFPL